jgi:hypothetical protein
MTSPQVSQASSPDTAPALLLELAKKYPSEVLANPALPLIALEDPELGARITNTAKLVLAEGELSAALRRLDAYDAAHFAVDCLERLRPYLGEPSELPRRYNPRRALEALRSRADARFDDASRAALLHAKIRGEHIISGPPEKPPTGGRLSIEAANRALFRAIGYIGHGRPDPAGEAHRFSDEIVGALRNVGEKAALEERRWQLERLASYLRRPRRRGWRQLWATLYYGVWAQRPWYRRRRPPLSWIALLVGASAALATALSLLSR